MFRAPGYEPRGLLSVSGLRRALRDLFAPEFIVLSAVLLGAFALSSGDLGIPLCPFKLATGLPCPGCGMTRACVALGHGQLAAALGFNLLVLVLFPVAAWHWNRLFWHLALGLEAPTFMPQRWLMPLGYGLAGFALVYWAGRLVVHWGELDPFGALRGVLSHVR